MKGGMILPAPAVDILTRADANQEVASVGLVASEIELSEKVTRGWTDIDETSRLAVPRRGHVLSTVAEFYGNPIRDAVAALSTSLARKSRMDIARSMRPLRGPDFGSEVDRSDAEMAARFIAAMWITGVATKGIPVSASLSEAEQWFFGGEPARSLTALPSGEATAKAEKSLRKNADASAYLELLPYILDPHGPGSRLSVRRDPATKTARSDKRADGVFYTPADVADYMASACLEPIDAGLPVSVFDPACGTGVFLRAALKKLLRRCTMGDTLSLASECLFGTDIDPWAVNATAFIVLADVLTEFPAATILSPFVSWQRLRCNFVRIDTLRIDPPAPGAKRYDDNCGRIPISRIFPALNKGPVVVMGNPPYADLGARSDVAELASTFRTIAAKKQPGAEIYLTFVEQMIRLAAPNVCAGALVLPLSIACNIGPQFVAMRKLIAETRGNWRFAFFDREPHALFGEDVKTRNAIVLWSRTPCDKSTVLATGPLRKWRGDSRALMFKTLNFTAIAADIRVGIPKIDGEYQATALGTLGARWSRLEQAVRGIRRQTLAAAPIADEQTVFVGPTAYNFLNVFLRPPRAVLQRSLTLSGHPLHAIACASRQDALALFALLSSHLAYWWWHTQGDGFHVSARFLSDFPFGIDALSGPSGEALSRYGEELWSTIRANPIISLNRGRTSLAFTPNGNDGIRRKIDLVLADLAGLHTAFVNELQQFTASTVAAKLRVRAHTETHQEGI